VNLGVAKDQRLSLNPSQISGACGRLMCCLRYEHEFYVQSRKRFPKEGKIIKTKVGEEKVIANDIFRERVTLRGEDGEQRTIELAELRAETDAVGFVMPISAAPPPLLEEELDESLMVEDVVIADAVVVVEPSTHEDDEDEDEDGDEDESPSDGPDVEQSSDSAVDPSSGQAVQQSPDPDAPKRPRRRRGRRGGRRNRPGGNRGPGGPPNDSPPPTSGN
jgi:hypothetical protein